MKFTTLFSAVALAAAMSTQVFATPTEVASDDFEDYVIPVGGESVAVKGLDGFSAAGWAVEDGDSSEIVATHFEGRGQALHLNTNGEILPFTAGTDSGNQATVSMKVEMVASDTIVDMSADTTSHTALFLYDPEDDETAPVLKAFSYDATEGVEDNVWVDLTADGFAIANGDVIDVSIAIDYNLSQAVYTVNGVTFQAIPLANPNAWAEEKKLNSVAFKGTGFVDDLFVSEEAVGDYVTFIYEVADAEPVSEPVRIDATGWGYYCNVASKDGYTSGAALWLRVDGQDDSLICDLTVAANGNCVVDGTTLTTPIVGATYVVKPVYTLKSSTVTVKDEGGTVIASATQDWFTSWSFVCPDGATFDGWLLDGYEQFDDIPAIGSLEADAYEVTLIGYQAGSVTPKTWTAAEYFKTITWTSYNPTLGTATFDFTAETLPEGDELGAFTVAYTIVLGGEEASAGNVWFGEVGKGYVGGLPTNGSALFLIGLNDAADGATEE